jgi:hypothetical protein
MKVKKVAKWTGIGVAALVGISIATSGGEEVPNTSTETTEAVAAPAEKKEAPKKEEKSSITKENYEKIVQGDSLSGKGGMSIEEVIAILGEPDDKMESQYDDGSGNTIKSENYSWHTLDFESISVQFTNGHVSHKMWMD